MKEHNFPYESFIGGWYIPTEVCDNLLDFYEKNKEIAYQGKLGNNNSDLTLDTEKKDCQEIRIPNNISFFPFYDYKKHLQECLENYVDWDAPACEGLSLDYLRQNGFARLNVGCKDTRAPHKNGNFPTESGKCELILKNAKSLSSLGINLLDQYGQEIYLNNMDFSFSLEFFKERADANI